MLLRERGMLCNGYGISDLRDGKSRRSVSQQCEYTEHYWTVHFNVVERVNVFYVFFFYHVKK